MYVSTTAYLQIDSLHFILSISLLQSMNRLDKTNLSHKSKLISYLGNTFSNTRNTSSLHQTFDIRFPPIRESYQHSVNRCLLHLLIVLLLFIFTEQNIFYHSWNLTWRACFIRRKCVLPFHFDAILLQWASHVNRINGTSCGQVYQKAVLRE